MKYRLPSFNTEKVWVFFTDKILDGERNIIFATEFFSSAQPNVTSHNVSFVYKQKLKKTLSAWGHCSFPPSLPPPPPPSFSRIFPNFIIAMSWHSVGIFWNFYRYHHFRTDGTFSVVVTPPKPSSFLWLQTELDSTQSYSDHYLSHEICLCMYSIVKKTRKWCLPTQKKFLQKLLREKKITASWILPTLLPNHFTTSITATATTKLYLRDHASTYSIAKDNYNNYFLRIWTKF